MKRIHLISLTCGVAAMAAMSSTAQKLTYPEAPHDNTVDTYYGEKVPDPFRPLEDDNSEATKAWVQAENKLTQAYLAKLPQRAKYLKRVKEVTNYEKVGIPFEKHGKWYLYRNNGTQNQSVLYQMDQLGGEQRVFLDPNTLSSDGTVALKDISFSHDGRYLAYVISRNGSDWEEIYVKDAKSGRQLDDHIVWAKFTSATWLGDGFYYSAYDAPEQGHETSAKNSVMKIYYHKIGTPQSQDVLFYQNPAQPLRFYSVSVNKEETMMFMQEAGMDQGVNLYVRDLRVPGSQFIQMTGDASKVYSPIEQMGDSIYIFTNAGAPRNRIMVADIRRPGFQDWKEVVPEADGVLDDVTFFGGNKMVLTYMKDNCSESYLYGIDGHRMGAIALPGVGSVSFSGKRERPECFYSFTSYTTPATVYRYDAATGVSTVYSKPKVNFNPADFVSEKYFYTSATARTRCSCTATAASMSPTSPISSPPTCHLSRQAASMSTLCCAAVASMARPGTWQAPRCRSRTCLTTSSRQPNGSSPTSIPTASTWPSWVAATAVCWWVPARPSVPTCSRCAFRKWA